MLLHNLDDGKAVPHISRRHTITKHTAIVVIVLLIVPVFVVYHFTALVGLFRDNKWLKRNEYQIEKIIKSQIYK